MSLIEDNPLKDFPTELVENIIKSFEGERDENGRFQGDGVATFLGGNSYSGSFCNSLMHGKGKYKWFDGVSFEGDFLYNSISGDGIYKWPNSPIHFSYEGGVSNGLRNGNGILEWEDNLGLRYEGSWKEGKRHGEGVLYFNWPTQKEINLYKGEWKYNQKDGFGIILYPSGNIYTGDWKEDKKHGNGRMVWKSQKLDNIHEIYQGEWKNGLPHGKGNYYWLKITDKDEKITRFARRNYYSGEWKEGKRNGKGIFYYADGGYYSGEWKENMKHGSGKFVFADGRIFDGNFENDKMLGFEREKNAQIYIVVLPSLQEKLTPIQMESLDRVIRQYISKLKDIFKYYSSIGYSGEDESLNMTTMQLCQFVKDSEIHSHKFTLASIQAILLKTLNCESFEPEATLLFRQFIEILVTISKAKYNEQEGYEKSFLNLINQHILTCNYRNRAVIKKKMKEIFSKKLEDKYKEFGITDFTAFKSVPSDLASSNEIWNGLEYCKKISNSTANYSQQIFTRRKLTISTISAYYSQGMQLI